MYSFPNFEPLHCSMSSSNYCFSICIQVSQEIDKVVWNSHLFKNFQVIVIHTVYLDSHTKGFGVVNETVDVFIEFCCFFYDPTDGSILSQFDLYNPQFDLCFLNLVLDN